LGCRHFGRFDRERGLAHRKQCFQLHVDVPEQLPGVSALASRPVERQNMLPAYPGKHCTWPPGRLRCRPGYLTAFTLPRRLRVDHLGPLPLGVTLITDLGMAGDCPAAGPADDLLSGTGIGLCTW